MSQPPELPYKLNELDQLAKKIVRRSVTIPGIQAKLSLHLANRGKQAKRLPGRTLGELYFKAAN